LGSKTGYSLWVGEKARICAFFLSRSALSLFFALFFLRAFALLFCLRAPERGSAKKAPAPTSGWIRIWICIPVLLLEELLDAYMHLHIVYIQAATARQIYGSTHLQSKK
jgi:hypothetical protein